MNSTPTATIDNREQLLAAREEALNLREQLLALREQALAASANRARPILLNSRLVVFGTRQDVAEMLDLAPDTVTDLVSDGVLPPPFDLTSVRNHNAQKTQGRRIQRWDLHEAAEWALRSRRLPHPALVAVASGSGGSPSCGLPSRAA